MFKLRSGADAARERERAENPPDMSWLAPKGAVQRWEYHTLTFEKGKNSQLWTNFGNQEYNTDNADLVLNHMGANGWELTGTVPHIIGYLEGGSYTDGLQLFFKRPLPQDG